MTFALGCAMIFALGCFCVFIQLSNPDATDTRLFLDNAVIIVPTSIVGLAFIAFGGRNA
jgi:hypothetical protein